MISEIISISSALIGVALGSCITYAATKSGALIAAKASTRNMILDKAIAAGIEEHRAALEAALVDKAERPPNGIDYYICAKVTLIFKMHGLNPPSVEKMIEAIKAQGETIEALNAYYAKIGKECRQATIINLSK